MSDTERFDTMSRPENDETVRPEADLLALSMQGTAYRETREYDYLNHTVSVTYRPIPDPISIPLTFELQSKLGITMDDARDQVEDAREEDGTIDQAELDEELVNILIRAARYSLDCEENDWSGEDLDRLVHSTFDGLIVELGMDAIEVSGTLAEAEEFRR